MLVLIIMLALTLLIEVTSSILVHLELLLHLYIVVLNHTFFLLHLILSVDFLEANLVRLVRSVLEFSSAREGKDLLYLFNASEDVLLVFLQRCVHIRV